MLFPLIKLAKKLKAYLRKALQNWEETEAFPLIKLAKKLKVLTLPVDSNGDLEFPLIKLAKKLKGEDYRAAPRGAWFPLIKLAKKLKA